MEKHNHYAIVAAVVLNQILGFVWYSSLLFGPLWLHEVGKPNEQLSQDGSLKYMAAVLAAVLLCYLMSWLFQMLVVDDWRRGLAVGLLIGCGFIAPALVMHYLFLGFPYAIILIDCTKEIIGAGMTGIILATFRAEPSNEIAA